MSDDDQKRRFPPISRRSFLKSAGAVAATTGLIPGSESEAENTESTADERIAEKLGPGAVTIELEINGEKKRLSIEPCVTLLQALREHLNLTGSKLVCDRGACGACTVHLDGKPVPSCMILAVDARGHKITTIEGLGSPATMHPVQESFVARDALQCGFCTPGMVMSVSAALAHNPFANVDEIRRATAGNICRCGTYPHVFEAALDAATKLRGPAKA